MVTQIYPREAPANLDPTSTADVHRRLEGAAARLAIAGAQNLREVLTRAQ